MKRKVVHSGYEVKWSNPNFKAAKILCNARMNNSWTREKFLFSKYKDLVTCKRCLKKLKGGKG